jgi:hypothetical protein
MKEIKTDNYNVLQKANISEDAIIGTRKISPDSLQITGKKDEKKSNCTGCSRAARNNNGSRQ